MPTATAAANGRVGYPTQIAKKLGWSGRTAAYLLGRLSADGRARCTFLCPDKARALVLARCGDALAAAGGGRADV